jgi:hypothetical protein
MPTDRARLTLTETDDLGHARRGRRALAGESTSTFDDRLAVVARQLAVGVEQPAPAT